MFKQLRHVVSFALVCSLSVSLTLVPMLAAQILRLAPSRNHPRQGLRGRFLDLSGRFFEQPGAGLQADPAFLPGPPFPGAGGGPAGAARQPGPDPAGGGRVHARHRRGRGPDLRRDGRGHPGRGGGGAVHRRRGDREARGPRSPQHGQLHRRHQLAGGRFPHGPDPRRAGRRGSEIPLQRADRGRPAAETGQPARRHLPDPGRPGALHPAAGAAGPANRSRSRSAATTWRPPTPSPGGWRRSYEAGRGRDRRSAQP